jgi:heme-degrading monooxygenase HmoA
MDKAPRLARCRLWRTHAPSSLQNIRLSADVGNPLSSRNSWAVGDGCVGARDADIARRRAQRCHGFPVSAQSPKTVGAASFVLTRVIDRRCSFHIKIDPSETETAERIWKTECATLMISQKGCICEKLLRARERGEFISYFEWETEADIERYTNSAAHKQIVSHTRSVKGASAVVKLYDLVS